jgi:soluble lytic murein transglycosylase-like protein
MGVRLGQEFVPAGRGRLSFSRMGPHLLALGALTLLALALPARADIYQCVAGDGSVHYTNSKPKGMRCKTAVRGSKQAPKKAPRGKARQARASQRTTPAPGAGFGGGGGNRRRAYDPLLGQAARFYQLPVAFLRAVVKVESDFNPQVVSHAGAMGLMQLMPRTAEAMGVTNPFDPRQNIFGGTRYLRILANKFNGDLVLTTAAYNAGEGAVMRYKGVPPYAETRRYVHRVLHHYYAFRQQGL